MRRNKRPSASSSTPNSLGAKCAQRFTICRNRPAISGEVDQRTSSSNANEDTHRARECCAAGAAAPAVTWWTDQEALAIQPEVRPVDQADVETSLTIRFRRRSIASSPTANTTIAQAKYIRLSNRAPPIA